jgi:hypothetical protein
MGQGPGIFCRFKKDEGGWWGRSTMSKKEELGRRGMRVQNHAGTVGCMGVRVVIKMLGFILSWFGERGVVCVLKGVF